MGELKTREDIASEHKWNLATVFETDDAWQKCLEAFEGSIGQVTVYKGTLGQSPENLLAALDTIYAMNTTQIKLRLYATLKHHQDTTNAFYQGMASKANAINALFQVAISFLDPEIISIGEEKLHQFLNEHVALQVYRHSIADTLRQGAHVLSTEMETLLAMAGEVCNGPYHTFNAMNHGDRTFKHAVDSHGEKHDVTFGSMGKLLESPDRALRESTHKVVMDSYIAQKNALATNYSHSVKKEIFKSKAKKHGSALAAALFENNIPEEIYTNLVACVNNGVHVHHRYLGIRKKCLQYDKLEAWDLSVPIVEDVDTSMPWEDAKAHVVAGLGVLGSEYQALVADGLSSGWIDVFENKGKHSGAYAFGAFGLKHPYVLMNYGDTMGGMFTLAHEMGHAIHYQYAHGHQPVPYAHFSNFLAEVASAVNEILLMEHLLKTTTDKAKHTYVLNRFITKYTETFFRQTMFGEFEMRSHGMAERGEPLNSASLNRLYLDIYTKYYGNEVALNEQTEFIWSRISHFYNPFYVYQYATGFVAAIALCKKFREEGKPAVDRYLKLLQSGACDYPINLLKEAGVDMTTPAPINDTVAAFGELLDMFEAARFGVV